ncbi:hypothetical protein MA9V2_160 [Chryseobacterium phage MA9V-2]|nr:hypothetical protein MA9V2_160 [Chryseobacterium phage MA9V-2]
MTLTEQIIAGIIVGLFSSPFFLMLFVQPGIHGAKEYSNKFLLTMLLLYLVVVDIISVLFFFD